MAARFPLDFEICGACLLPGDVWIVSKFFPYKRKKEKCCDPHPCRNVCPFAHYFSYRCKIKIIVHNHCSLFPQDKLRVCIFKAFDNHSTNYISKGWANFHPNQKGVPYRGNYTAMLLSFSICLSSKEIDYFSYLNNYSFSFVTFPSVFTANVSISIFIYLFLIARTP